MNVCKCDRPLAVDRECFKCGRPIDSAAVSRADRSAVPLAHRPRPPAVLTRDPVLMVQRIAAAKLPGAERPTHCLVCGDELPPRQRMGRPRLYCVGQRCKQRASEAIHERRVRRGIEAAAEVARERELLELMGAADPQVVQLDVFDVIADIAEVDAAANRLDPLLASILDGHLADAA